MELMPIHTAIKKGLFPLSKSTAWRWQREEKHPGLFLKIGGRVFFNVKILNELLLKGMFSRSYLAFERERKKEEKIMANSVKGEGSKKEKEISEEKNSSIEPTKICDIPSDTKWPKFDENKQFLSDNISKLGALLISDITWVMLFGMKYDEQKGRSYHYTKLSNLKETVIFMKSLQKTLDQFTSKMAEWVAEDE